MNNLAAHVTDFFVKKKIIEPDMKEIYCYGFELIISDVINFSLILLAGLCYGILTSSVLFLLCFVTVRIFCGGYHAKTSMVCRIVTMAAYLLAMGGAYIFRTTALNSLWIGAVCALVIIVLLAPVENENKPLSKEKKRRNRRRGICSALLWCAGAAVLYINGRPEAADIVCTLIIVSILLVIGRYRTWRRICL
jgi:accessory gene regulator B